MNWVRISLEADREPLPVGIGGGGGAGLVMMRLLVCMLAMEACLTRQYGEVSLRTHVFYYTERGRLALLVRPFGDKAVSG